MNINIKFYSTLLIGLPLGMASCAAPVDMAKVDTLNAVDKNTGLSGRTYNLPRPTPTDTQDLPLITVETPTGPREIFDQSKNPDLIKALKGRRAYIANPTGIRDFEKITNRIMGFQDVQRKDYLRLGCMEVLDTNCSLNYLYFEEDCGEAHNFGSTRLSACEQSTKVKWQRQTAQLLICEVNGQKIDLDNSSDTDSLEDQAKSLTNMECLTWRPKAP